MKTLLLAGAIALSLATTATAAVVDLNSLANASLNGSNGVDLFLNAGTYQLSAFNGTYGAFTRFANVTGCDADGKNCSQGYEVSFRAIADGFTYGFGDGSANGGIGPISPGDGYFANQALALAASTGLPASLTVNTAQNVRFFIYDDVLGDNSGGVSINISAGPEPESWALMIAGLAGAGAMLRRRRAGVAAQQAV
jgi:hypothetical protein